ncbi:MAG: toprim domain-containing protein, partial [Desulfamplus sp.]|nr:toprim domain-containing protein [Desulfamplus sp.]
ISLYQNGIKNCVATLGTALTMEHVRMLKGYASKIFLVFDSDDAGINAAKRSVDLFVKEGVELYVIVLPRGQDPDSFVREYGAEAFELAAMKAMSVIEFLTEMAVKKHGLSIEGKVAILEEIKVHLAAIQNRTARSLYIRETAHLLGIDEGTVLEKIRQTVVASQTISASQIKNTNFTDNQTIAVMHGNNNKPNIIDNGFKSCTGESEPRELQILSMMLQFPEIIDEIKKSEVLESFYSSRLKVIGRLILNIADVSYCSNSNNKNLHSHKSNSHTSNLNDSNNKDKGPYVDYTGLVGDVIRAVPNDADKELIASLAMMEVADVEDVLEKSLFIIKRVIHVRKRNESTLTHEIRKIEHAIKVEKNSEQDIKTKYDSDMDLTLELLRQRQIEIRQLRGYE